MKLEITRASIADAPVLRELLNHYLYDLSDLGGTTDLDERGRYGYEWLERYWTEGDRHALLVRAGGALAGFAFVNTQTHTAGAQWSIAEFFVVRRHRRAGIGTRAAHETFARLPGRWEVWTDKDNVGAHAFWRHAVSSFTDGVFEERREGHGGGPTFLFESGGDR